MGDLVRQRFRADGNTDISGFNDVLKKPFKRFQELQNSPMAEIFFWRLVLLQKNLRIFMRFLQRGFFLKKSRILLDPTFSDSQNFNWTKAKDDETSDKL